MMLEEAEVTWNTGGIYPTTAGFKHGGAKEWGCLQELGNSPQLTAKMQDLSPTTEGMNSAKQPECARTQILP